MPFDRSLRCKKDYPGFGGSVTTLKVLYNYDSDQYQCKNTSKAVSRFPNAKKSIADDLPRLQGASGLRRRSFVGSNPAMAVSFWSQPACNCVGISQTCSPGSGCRCAKCKQAAYPLMRTFLHV